MVVVFWRTRKAILVLFGVLLGHSWRPLGALLALQGLCRVFAGGGTLQRPCKDPAKLESWRPLRAVLGRIDQKEGRRQFEPPHRRLKHAVMGPFWAALGALLGALGAVLGPSWAPLGAVLGHLGAILRPQEPIGGERARRQKTLIFFRFLKGFGLLGGSLEASEGT